MHRLLGIAVIALALWLSPGVASAAVLPTQTRLDLFLFGLPTVSVTGQGPVTVTGGGAGPVTGLTLPASMLSTAGVTIDVTDPAADPIHSIEFGFANAAGSFAVGTRGMSGDMALVGLAKVCLFFACGEPGSATLSLPLSAVGQPITRIATSGNLTVSLAGSPWTTASIAPGRFASQGVLPEGTVHGPLSATSSATQPGGTLSLVTPIFISTSIPGSAAIISAYGMLEVHVVPEPGTLLQLTAGMVALALVGRQRNGGRPGSEEGCR